VGALSERQAAESLDAFRVIERDTDSCFEAFICTRLLRGIKPDGEPNVGEQLLIIGAAVGTDAR
jgi:hypothetical protein